MNNIINLINLTLVEIFLANLLAIWPLKVLIAVEYYIEISINLLLWLKTNREDLKILPNARFVKNGIKKNMSK